MSQNNTDGNDAYFGGVAFLVVLGLIISIMTGDFVIWIFLVPAILVGGWAAQAMSGPPSGGRKS